MSRQIGVSILYPLELLTYKSSLPSMITPIPGVHTDTGIVGETSSRCFQVEMGWILLMIDLLGMCPTSNWYQIGDKEQ